MACVLRRAFTLPAGDPRKPRKLAPGAVLEAGTAFAWAGAVRLNTSLNQTVAVAVLAAFGLLITALTTANTLFAWLSVAVSVIAAGLLALGWSLPSRAAPVDWPLLLVDASGSIDAAENALQNEAYVRVLRDPEIVALLAGAPGAGKSALVHELRRSGGGLGLAAVCSGGGQGDALLIEV